MAIDQKDILLDESDDLHIVDGDFVVGESVLQELGLMSRLNQGELKQDPILGMGLIRYKLKKVTALQLKRLLKINLIRDSKTYEEVKDLIELKAKKQ